MRTKKGFTLVELLIGISITAILTGVVIFALKTCLDTYHYVQDDLFLQQAIDETLQVVSDGDFELYGIKDSFEILNAENESITFVPLWVDDTHLTTASTKEKPQQFVLNRAFKAGASLPIGEILIKGKLKSTWKKFAIAFFIDPEVRDKRTEGTIIFKDDVPIGSRARFIFQPDALKSQDVVMTIKRIENEVVRIYRDKISHIPKDNVRHVLVKRLWFQYFDSTNTEIKSSAFGGKIPKERLQSITAVKVNAQVEASGVTKEGNIFINLRNTKTAGAGIIVTKGSKLQIPNSKDIRAFSLMNISGVQDGDKIVLKAVPQKGNSWTIILELGIRNNVPTIYRYSIEYPAGQVVHAENINHPADRPLNFLTLGNTGRYDYDFDQDDTGMNDVTDIVNLTDEVELTVVEMDPSGAALFIRP